MSRPVGVIPPMLVIQIPPTRAMSRAEDEDPPEKRQRMRGLNEEDRMDRRKMKNRESAQRARDRKQTKLDELEITIAGLRYENAELKAHNSALKEQLEAGASQDAKELCGSAARAQLPSRLPRPALRSSALQPGPSTDLGPGQEWSTPGHLHQTEDSRPDEGSRTAVVAAALDHSYTPLRLVYLPSPSPALPPPRMHSPPPLAYEIVLKADSTQLPTLPPDSMQLPDVQLPSFDPFSNCLQPVAAQLTPETMPSPAATKHRITLVNPNEICPKSSPLCPTDTSLEEPDLLGNFFDDFHPRDETSSEITLFFDDLVRDCSRTEKATLQRQVSKFSLDSLPSFARQESEFSLTADLTFDNDIFSAFTL